MSALVTGDEFAALFTGFDRTAVRLETRDRYAMADEAEPCRRFLAGAPVPIEWFSPWLDLVSRAVSDGKRFRRVRVVPEPLTDYLRFELWLCQFNVEAGEDIAYVDSDIAAALLLPPYDYWLFDNERLARMHFDRAGHLLGAEIVTDPDAVDHHGRAWETAYAGATPYRQYAAHHPVTATIE